MRGQHLVIVSLNATSRTPTPPVTWAPSPAPRGHNG